MINSSAQTQLQARSDCQLRSFVQVSSTYWTIEHVLSLVAPFLDVTLQRTRVERLQQLETAQQLVGDSHDGTPIIELTAVLWMD